MKKALEYHEELCDWLSSASEEVQEVIEIERGAIERLMSAGTEVTEIMIQRSKEIIRKAILKTLNFNS